jgi:alkaline phosphatase
MPSFIRVSSVFERIKMTLFSLLRCSFLLLVAYTVCFVQMASAAPSFTPLALSDAANTGFSDTQAEDEKGGWTDQGGNDLSVISAGKLTLSGVLFSILDETATPGKTCIVLGGPKRPYLPAKAAIPVPNVSGKCLYLLHAAAWCPPAKDQKMTGVLFIDYEDGSSKEVHVRFGRDVGDWASPDSYKNAARIWTAYNANTQVSLFLSRFPLKALPVKAIRLESRDSAWMTVAATIGDETDLKPMKPNFVVTQQFVSPPPFDKPLLDAPADAVPKNIILIIGDGMGQGALKLTSLYQHKAEGRLLMQQLPVAGFCTTRSSSSEVTDSAAAATAIASGCKTANGFLGITPDKKQQLTSFTEVAHRGGRAVGLLTSDSITGATPSGFYAHEISRNSYQGVALDAAASGYDVLIGNSNGKPWFLPKAASGLRTDTRDVLSEMTSGGYVIVSNTAAFAQAPHDKKILGFMDTKTVLGSEQILGQLTETALNRLSKNDKGFFLMVECAITDAGGHSNNPDLTVLGTTQVDWAVRSAVEFARARGDTLVMVTADHETGNLTSVITNTPPGKLVIDYSTTKHTGAPVRLYAYGPGSTSFKDTVDNTDIAKNICRFWQLTLPPPIPFSAK